MVAPRPLALLLLTEDSGSDAHATFEHVARRSCRLLVEQCQTHRVEMRPANDDARAALRGNAWKERKKQQPDRHNAYVTLLKTIATTVCTPDGFVLFHIDGDRSWGKAGTSENVQAFQELVVAKVRQLIVQNNQVAVAAKRAPYDVEACLARLIPIVPYYSIEAWLYQNTVRAIAICTERYAGRDVETFAAWAADRALVDEIPQIKRTVCLGAQHNLELARSLDVAALEAVGTSYSATVMRLRAQTALVAALQRTADDAS